MTELGLYAAAWHDRKRRFFAFRTVQVAGIPVVIAAAYLSSKWSRSALIAVPVWFFGYLLVGIWLNRFR